MVPFDEISIRLTTFLASTCNLYALTWYDALELDSLTKVSSSRILLTIRVHALALMLPELSKASSEICWS